MNWQFLAKMLFIVAGIVIIFLLVDMLIGSGGGTISSIFFEFFTFA